MERDSLVLELSDGSGLRGLGEAAPLVGYSPDSLWDAGLSLAALEIAEDPSDLSSLTRLLGGAPITASARCAAETALVDFVSRHQGISAPAFLGSTADAEVPICTLIEDGPLEAQLAQAQEARTRGIDTLKIKIGRPGRLAAECELLAELRRAGGPSLRLRADANGAFETDDLRAAFDALLPYDLEFIEEPIAHGRWDQIRSSPIPLAADESLQQESSRTLALDALDRGILRVAVLKATTLGGPLSCLALGAMLAGGGAELVVGHVFEGPITHAASMALALALASRATPAFASGLDRHAGLSAWPGSELPFPATARVGSWKEPGLGVSVPES
jgi:L-alanine-DL-glutamate epimerase-like enolase superfamily enzyme